MVLQRRLDYGFSGYQVPVVPRASRSARGRGPIRKKRQETRIRAFEILASVAGKLLQESKCSAPPSVACEKYQHNLVNYTLNWGKESEDPCRQENCTVQSFATVPEFQGHHQSYELNKFWRAQDNLSFKFSSTSKNVDQSEKKCFTEKLDTINCKNACAGSSSKVVGDSFCYADFFEGKEEGVVESKLEAEPSKKRSINGAALFTGCSEDLMELDRKPSAPISSGSDLKVSLSRDCISPGPFPGISANIKVVSRDDDENSVGCTQPATRVKAYRPSPNIGDRRIRKFSALKHWRVAPTVKNGGHVRNDGKKKPVYRNGRTYCTHHRSQRFFPFKKRRFFYQSPLSAPDEGCNCEGVFDSPEKRINGDNPGAALGASSSVPGQHAHPESSDCNVKFSIKSFKVPELFVEIPATATVGSLKRTVMEAVTAILGEGLHVGILLQGKKVRDDSKTLLQTGISQDGKRQTLGFMLEPGHAQLIPSLRTEDPPLLSGGTPQGFIKHSASLTLQPGTSNISPDSPVTNLGSCIESDRDAVPSLADTSVDYTMPESRALVAVPAISMEALAVVPFHRKPGHPEYVPRRIRRPFSVSEVEALVQAVEKLGTGRWRDVKLRAFDSAKHRTYVDLKDKWKTLVHTARISPQQRRGEPVPQELLDRVLAAHSFWSQQQAKQQVKAAV